MDQLDSAFDTDSNSDSTNSDSIHGQQFTVINADGLSTGSLQEGKLFTTENGPHIVHAPNLRYVQIGNGRIAVVGGTKYTVSKAPCTGHQQKDHDDKHNPEVKPISKKPLTESKSPPSTSDLNHICNNIGKAWKRLARALDLSKAAIDTIQVDYRAEGTYEMAWQAILKTRRKRIEDVTLGEMARLLDDIGFEQLARELPVDR